MASLEEPPWLNKLPKMRFSLFIPILTLVTCLPEDFDAFTECLVPDLNLACTNRCEAVSLDCITNCDSDDTACYSQCLREIAQCFNDCPCELNCLDGCEECDNPVCDCQEVEKNPDWNRCIDDNSLKLGRCIHSCSNNQDCEDDCLNRFKSRQLNCPCEENCAAGCPCSEFDCIATTPEPDVTTTTIPATTTSPISNAVFVMNTWNPENKPLVVDFNGNINEDLAFEYGDETDAKRGCGATLKNEFWYLGGYSTNKRQVSKIVGCKLEHQADLTFDFTDGACNTFLQPDPKVLLCFGTYEAKECHTFDGEFFHSAGSSSCSHHYTFGMANYKGKAFITGCNLSKGCDRKTELMDMNTLRWSNGPDYPFTSKQIYGYSAASTSEAAYIIGGDYTRDVIAEFKGNTWRNLGSLTKARSRQSSISLGDETMIIGGSSSDNSDVETEIWNFTNQNHKIINPVLKYAHYKYGVGLYIVPFHFCSV